MTNRLTDDQGRALVRLIGTLRPDWESQSVAAAIRRLVTADPFLVCDLALHLASIAKYTPADIRLDSEQHVAEKAAQPVPSIGRDNVVRLRREQATLADTAASSERIAAIRALSKFPRNPTPEGPA